MIHRLRRAAHLTRLSLIWLLDGVPRETYDDVLRRFVYTR